MFISSGNNPKGPDLTHKEKYVFDLSGSHLEIVTPHSNYKKMPDRLTSRFSGNIYDLAEMSDAATGSKARTYRSLGCGARYWRFSGLPIFQPELASLKLGVSVAHFPEFGSLFRPRRFEKAIERRLYCGDGTATKSYTNRANWLLCDKAHWLWVSYEIIQDITRRGLGDVYWCTPISDEHMLTLHFEKSFFSKNAETLEKAFKPVIDCVTNSIKFTPSSDAIQQRKEAQEQYPHEKLSESMPPYVFDRVEVQDEVYIFTQVSKKHSDSWTYEQIDKEAKRIHKQQQKEAMELEEKILASHLAFDE